MSGNYIFDTNGSPVGFRYRGVDYASGAWDTYAYEKNIQGDIVAVYDTATGNKLIAYKYNAWGACTTSYYNGGSSTTATKNPFKYRGYYYDSNLGLYYLQSRYYDQNTGRFISPDSLMSGVNGNLHGFNLYAYCFNNPISYTDSQGNWPQWMENAANWVNNNIIQPVASFVEETIDYLTPPSMEEHYDRNQNNIQFPEEYDGTFFENWDDSVSANCHQFSASDRDNIKYVSPDGRYEAIYNASNELVTDPRDVGTYNFVSPNEDPFGHFIKDVIPWIQYGNSPDDSTEWWQRALSLIAIYV